MEVTIKQGLESCPEARFIREEVFVKEQGFTTEFDHIDHSAWHILLTEQGRPAATGRTFPKEGEPGTWIIGRVAVMKNMRSLGAGRLVIGHLEQQIRTLGGSRAELSAQVQAQTFYEKLGYECLGDLHMDEHCPHVTMVKGL